MEPLGQVQSFIDKTATVAPPDVQPIETAKGPDTLPTVPFPTALQLTGNEEERLVQHCLRRLQQLEEETGRTVVADPNWWRSPNYQPERHNETWMLKRARFEALMENDLSWRPAALGGIFNESNLTCPVSRRITKQTIARANNYYFATDPWFDAEPQGIEDQALAEKIKKYATWKLGKLGSKRTKERAVRHACVRGECVVKTVYAMRDQIYQTFLTVLADAKDQPIMARDGDYITQSDEWAVGQGPSAGMVVLARDGVTPQPPVMNWVRTRAKRRQVLFEGPESLPVYYKDFLAPLTATDLQTADTVVHLYDKRVNDLVQQFIRQGAIDGTGTGPIERQEQTKRAIDLLRALAGNNTAPKSAANRAAKPKDTADDDGRGDWQTHAQGDEPVAEIAEVYAWYDVDGDGIAENVMVLIDRGSKRPIFYDYVANLTHDGRRPFEVVRINEVDGRWYGQGVMETFDAHQIIIDLTVNRWNKSQGSAGRVDFWKPHLTEEGRANPDLRLNWGGTYTLIGDHKAEEVLTSIYLNDIKFERLQTMFEFFLQIAMNESGVQHVNDAQAAGLDTAKLATGIRNLERAGQELFAPILSDLEPGLQGTLTREIGTLLANLQHEEVFRYLEGDETITAAVAPEEVQHLDLDVQMLLTRYRNEQQFQQMLQGAEVIERFYALTPEVQARVAPFYQGMIKSLDTKVDAEAVIAPLPPPIIDPATGQPVAQPPGFGGNGSPRPAQAPRAPTLDPEQGSAATAPKPPGVSPANL